MSLKDLTRWAMALSPAGGGVKELVRDSVYLCPVYKTRVYSAIAWSTGLTFHEIGKLADEVRFENRRRT
jgi:hypothetical protein